MKEDDTQPFEAVTDEVSEARIVAWVLGEASAFEIAELERLCGEKPELEIFRRRMLALQGLLVEAVGEDQDAGAWKLSGRKRRGVEEAFGMAATTGGSVVLSRKRRSWKWMRPLIGIAACLISAVAVWRFSQPERERGGFGALGLAGEETESMPLEKIVDFSSSGGGGGFGSGRADDPDQLVTSRQRQSAPSSVIKRKDMVRPRTATSNMEGNANPVAPLPAAAPAPADSEIAGIMTGGLRSGDQTINRGNIDAFLNNPDRLKEAPEEAAPLGKGVGSGLARREMPGAAKTAGEGDRLLAAGRDAYAKGDYKGAVESYRKAMEQLPDSPDLQDRRTSYTEHLGDASVALAQEQRRVGKYAEAKSLLEGVLAPNVDPNNAAAKRELSYLEDPIRTSSALADEHTRNMDTARRGLYMAEGNYNLGKYEDAKKEYEGVLRTDPYNAAARRGLERLAVAKSDYYRAAYDHTRAELLAQVDSAWELTVPADGQAAAGTPAPEIPKALDAIEMFSKVDGADQVRGTIPDLSKLQLPSAGLGGSMVDGLSSLAGSDNDRRPGSDPFADVSPVIPPTDPVLEPQKPLEGPGQPMLLAADGSEKSQPLVPLPGMDATYEFKGLALVEEKPPLEEQTFDEIHTAEEAFSTFSLNVGDVSFQLAKTALERGGQPAPASIKVEQFYNAVDYGDPSPESNEPVAGVVEQSAHPIIPGRNLVRLGIRTASAGRSKTQPLRLTLLIDQSGSMVREDRKAAMTKAIDDLSKLMTAGDEISVIGFSRAPKLLMESVPGNGMGGLRDLINPEASEGGTNLEEAMKLARSIAVRHRQDGAQNRIVLFTDGAANLGDADPIRLAALVTAMRQEGLAFDVAGIGAEGLNDGLLAKLARNGNGRYYVAADNLAAQLAGAFRPAAEDVKVQVKFNPERVSRYKLIGFEESRLKNEDFRDDTVDAAELAAEEAAVAVYQVELIPDGKGVVGEMSVRFRDAGSGGIVERAWTIAQDDATPAFDRASPSMQLAGLSMLAGQKLQGGPLADAIDFRGLSGPISRVRQYYSGSSKTGDMLRLIGLLSK